MLLLLLFVTPYFGWKTVVALLDWALYVGGVESQTLALWSSSANTAGRCCCCCMNAATTTKIIRIWMLLLKTMKVIKKDNIWSSQWIQWILLQWQRTFPSRVRQPPRIWQDPIGYGAGWDLLKTTKTGKNLHNSYLFVDTIHHLTPFLSLFLLGIMFQIMSSWSLWMKQS